MGSPLPVDEALTDMRQVPDGEGIISINFRMAQIIVTSTRFPTRNGSIGMDVLVEGKEYTKIKS